MNSYDKLIEKLNNFIRKYYLNQIIRGLILFTAIILSTYLFVSLVEYKAYFSTNVRLALVTVFTIAFVIGAYHFIVNPLLKFFRLGKQISQEQAAQIIGAHFKDVEDKLLNILQLKKQAETNENQLLIAGIEQKSVEIKPIPFANAIDLTVNKKYVRFLLPSLLILLSLLLIAPNILSESTSRLINPTMHFEKAAPFKFFITDSILEVVQYEDLQLEVNVEGSALPQEAYYTFNGNKVKMERIKADKFAHRINNIQEETKFFITANGFQSKEFKIKVIPKPMLTSFKIELAYPPYTQKTNEIISNTGDITVPEGTKAKWVFNTSNTEVINYKIESQKTKAERESKGLFTFNKVLKNDLKYTIFLSNNQLSNVDSSSFQVEVIKDQFPTVEVEQIEDSAVLDYKYFLGDYSDDYGVSALEFIYTTYTTENKQIKQKRVNLGLSSNRTLAQFTHNLDIKELNLKPGERVEYYFEVWDNDGVNGRKSARSQNFVFKKPTKEEYKEIENKNSENVKSNIESAFKQVNDFNKEIEKIKEKVLNKKNLTWEDKKSIEQLKQKHQDISKDLEQAIQDFNQNIENQQEFKEVDPAILEKQEQLQKMMEELLTDEMKELLEKLEKLAEEMLQNNAFEQLKDFELTNEKLEQELDRMLELFKKLEFEQKLQDAISELEKLAQQQEELQKETEKGDKSSEELKQKQDELNKKFDDFKKDMDKVNELNNEQKKSLDLRQENRAMDGIKQHMDGASEQLDKNKKKKAGENQNNASEQMKMMARSMGDKLSAANMTQTMEDIDDIRQLLDNLVKLSFDQEELIAEVKKTTTDNPKFRDLVQHQHKLRNDAKLIEDSLVTLSKRVFQLEKFITDELYDMNREFDKSIYYMGERMKSMASASQQYIMTSANNLALMLNEIMEQMQNQMAQQMDGNQQCQNPGSGKPKPSLMNLQKDLGEQLKQMEQMLKEGKDPKKMSKEFGTAAAQQAAIREALRKMKESMSQDQKNNSEIDKLMNEMDKTETDLVNRKITQEMLKRQQEILTRMLEFKKAEKQQGQEEKRESNTGKDIVRKIPPSMEEYINKRKSEVDMYKTTPPNMNLFYKNIVERYFKNLN